jgi:type I restriction enzyme M protein
MTLSDVAKRAGVRLSAVSNWRTRHSDFPIPQPVSGQEFFEASEIAKWLQRRRIPHNRLKADESPGTSYGDRFLRNIDISDSSTMTSRTREAHPPESTWRAQLWAAADRLRGTHDTASSLEFLLGLAYVKKTRADVWRSLVGASNWVEVYDLLTNVSLPVATGISPVLIFGKVSRTADPSLIEAVHLIDKIGFGGDDGPQSTAAKISDEILADLERGMGRSGGRFTPPDVARCVVELIDPQPSDRVYDPFCGSGELLSAAAAYVGRQSGSLGSWQVYGQTPQEWSWLTSTMNLTLHGVQADLGLPGNALQEDGFPKMRFSRILANPPFNQRVDVPPRRTWPFGKPPAQRQLRMAAARVDQVGR